MTSPAARLVDEPVTAGTEVRVLREYGAGSLHQYADIEVAGRHYQVTARWLKDNTH